MIFRILTMIPVRENSEVMIKLTQRYSNFKRNLPHIFFWTLLRSIRDWIWSTLWQSDMSCWEIAEKMPMWIGKSSVTWGFPSKPWSFSSQRATQKQFWIQQTLSWLVVYLPLWKIWGRQLGLWHSQYMEKVKMFQTTTNQRLLTIINHD